MRKLRAAQKGELDQEEQWRLIIRGINNSARHPQLVKLGWLLDQALEELAARVPESERDQHLLGVASRIMAGRVRKLALNHA